MPIITRTPAEASAVSGAACGLDAERMFPVDESNRPGRMTAGERRALAVCQACPLLSRCRSVVLTIELPYGVAGGLTAAERRAVRASEGHDAA